MGTSASVARSIILPIHNQEDHVAAIVEAYIGALLQHSTDFELLLVTNGCTDRSVERCALLAERFEQVQLLALDRGGWGYAVRSGIEAARGDILCYTNSARTAPELLTLMLLYATIYPDVIIKANRRLRESFRRRAGSLLYNLECRALFDLSVWDINGTPKIFPRSFDRLLRLTRDDDLIDLEFNVVAGQAGYRILEVPVLSTERHGGKSTTTFRSALNMYRGALSLARQDRFR